MSTRPTVRVAVVQAASVGFNKQACIDKAAKLVAEAAQKGAQLVSLPEAFVPGYTFFEIESTMPDAKRREQYRIYLENSIVVPSADSDQLAAIAAANRVHLVAPVIERDPGLGTLYCSVLFFSSEGAFLGKHRKLVPTYHERMFWGRGDGSTLPVLDTPIGRLGAVICYENFMPLLRTTMYAKGVEIYCAPNLVEGAEWLATVRHIALEGRCFVLSANQVARKKDYPTLFQASEELLCRAGSCIVDPLGNVLAGPVFEEEVILYADLDLNLIARGKADLDVVGHYSRPDVFQLTVNESPRKAIFVKNDSPNEKSGEE